MREGGKEESCDSRGWSIGLFWRNVHRYLSPSPANDVNPTTATVYPLTTLHKQRTSYILTIHDVPSKHVRIMTRSPCTPSRRQRTINGYGRRPRRLSHLRFPGGPLSVWCTRRAWRRWLAFRCCAYWLLGSALLSDRQGQLLLPGGSRSRGHGSKCGLVFLPLCEGRLCRH